MEYIQEFNETENDGPRRVRVIVMGAPGVGKSSLLNRMVRNMFFENQESLSIIQGKCREMKVLRTLVFYITFWDRSGHRQYHGCSPFYNSQQNQIRATKS